MKYDNKKPLGYMSGCTPLLIFWFFEHTNLFSSMIPQTRPRMLKWAHINSFKNFDMTKLLDVVVNENCFDLLQNELMLLDDCEKLSKLSDLIESTKSRIQEPIALQPSPSNLQHLPQVAQEIPEKTATQNTFDFEFIIQATIDAKFLAMQRQISLLEESNSARFLKIESKIEEILFKLDELKNKEQEVKGNELAEEFTEEVAQEDQEIPDDRKLVEVSTMIDSIERCVKARSKRKQKDIFTPTIQPNKKITSTVEKEVIDAEQTLLRETKTPLLLDYPGKIKLDALQAVALDAFFEKFSYMHKKLCPGRNNKVNISSFRGKQNFVEGVQENDGSKHAYSSHATRRARRTQPAEERKDNKRRKKLTNFCSSVSDKTKSSKNILKYQRITCKKKCNGSNNERNKSYKRKREVSLIIPWLGVYTDEVSEEEKEPLINKRSVRRTKLKESVERSGQVGLTFEEVIYVE